MSYENENFDKNAQAHTHTYTHDANTQHPNSQRTVFRISIWTNGWIDDDSVRMFVLLLLIHPLPCSRRMRRAVYVALSWTMYGYNNIQRKGTEKYLRISPFDKVALWIKRISSAQGTHTHTHKCSLKCVVLIHCLSECLHDCVSIWYLWDFLFAQPYHPFTNVFSALVCSHLRRPLSTMFWYLFCSCMQYDFIIVYGCVGETVCRYHTVGTFGNIVMFSNYIQWVKKVLAYLSVESFLVVHDIQFIVENL